jgi:hypothetical protein
VPERPSEAVTRAGDLWTCGAHRVLCGDATDRDSVSRLLVTTRPELMVTDPPYGIAYNPAWREQAGLGRQRQVGLVQNDDRADWAAAYALFPGSVMYVWHAGLDAAEVAMGIQAAGFELRAQIIWVKQHFALSRGMYHWQHEPCWLAVRQDARSKWPRCPQRGDPPATMASVPPDALAIHRWQFDAHAFDSFAFSGFLSSETNSSSRAVGTHSMRPREYWTPARSSGPH